MEEYIFWFNDRGPLQIQNDDVCQKIWVNIWSFVEQSKKNDTKLFDVDHLIELKSTYCRVEWLARYGAAVLFWPSGADRMMVKMVGLDKWEFGVHSSHFSDWS